MEKRIKTTPAPFFITELAEVQGGRRRSTPTLINREDGVGTSRMLGEEGQDGGGFSE